MTLSGVLEVALGLALIYYVLSLAVSYITTVIARYTQLRAKNLASELKELLGEGEGPVSFEKFIKHPWIQILAPKEINFFWKKQERAVDRIPPQRFVITLLNLWFPDKTLSDPISLDEIQNAIDNLPNGKYKEALLDAVDTSVGKVQEVGRLIEIWFDDAMQNIASLYKQRARSIVIGIALIVTLVTGVDSIEVATALWESDVARAELAAMATGVAQTEPDAESPPTLGELEEKINVPLGWSADDLAQFRQLEPDVWSRKILGLLITWVAIAQGSSFWYQILKGIRQSTERPKTEEARPSPGETLIAGLPSSAGESAREDETQFAVSKPVPPSSPPVPADKVPDLERLAQLAAEVARTGVDARMALVLLKGKVEQEELAVSDDQIEEAIAAAGRKEAKDQASGISN